MKHKCNGLDLYFTKHCVNLSKLVPTHIYTNNSKQNVSNFKATDIISKQIVFDSSIQSVDTVTDLEDDGMQSVDVIEPYNIDVTLIRWS